MKSTKSLAEKERSLALRYGEYLNKNFGMGELRKSEKKPPSVKRKSSSKASPALLNNYMLKIAEKKSLPVMLTPKTKLEQKERPVRQRHPDSKININFEIKNLNIFKSSATHALRKGHKKTLTTLQQPPALPEAKKSKQKPKMILGVTSPKANGHRKVKSQDLDAPKDFDPNKFIGEDSQSTSVGSYFVCSRAGMLEDKPKVNQDAFICIPRFVMNNISLYGVCDGHGINGHFVSEFVREILPENIEYYSIKNKMFLKEPRQEIIETVLKQSFKKTSIDLQHSQIDVSFSGSTAVMALVVQDYLYCANIGDSRAVVCSQNKDFTWKAKSLSTDHKADLPQEAERILKNRGRLQPYRDDNGEQMGPYRVWLQHQQIPGLAMTRSFGDAVASSVGVISDPEVTSHRISKADKFLILASDGLWEFISNEEAMQAVVPCFMRNDIQEAVRELQQLALTAWVEEDQLIDDITIIVVFFKNY